MDPDWPKHLDVGAVRFVRPTVDVDVALGFYRDVLGLAVLAQWRDHDGYDGAVIGLPGSPVHLELVRHDAGAPLPAPHPENQIVLYLRGIEALTVAVSRLSRHGHEPVEAQNPYWDARGAVVYVDPDGWRVVFAPWVFGEDRPPAV